MTTQTRKKLNQLERLLPEGLLVDSVWLSAAGYSSSLRSKYVTAGWLEQPARRVYRRPRGRLGWQQIVISLQLLLHHRILVGGRSALELQGYAHYLSQNVPEIHLHGPSKPPTWVAQLGIDERLVYRNSAPLFGNDLVDVVFPTLEQGERTLEESKRSLSEQGAFVLPWGQWDWPLIVSSPERAVLELLDELPDQESFHQVDVLMEGLSHLAPRRLQPLLVRCRSIKVKRLFFLFADRHSHPWLKRLDRSAVDLGSGKRVLVQNGRLDPRYQITVPRNLE